MPESGSPAGQTPWPTEDVPDDVSVAPDSPSQNALEQNSAPTQWPGVDNDVTLGDLTDGNLTGEDRTEVFSWPTDDEPTLVCTQPDSPPTVPASARPDLSAPVSNEQARLDPPTLQFIGPTSAGSVPAGPGELPTIRIRIPQPEPKQADTPAEPAAEPEQTHDTDKSKDTPQPQRKHRKLLITGIALIVVIGAVIGVGLVAPGSIPGLQALGIGAPSTSPAPTPADPAFKIQPVADTSAQPTAQGITSALASLATNPALGTLTGSVIDPTTGTTLWQRDAGKPLTPASAGKLLTTSAALLTLDPQSRLTTKVVAGPDPQTVVLVAGGDPTLSSLPDGQESAYPGAAHLDDLVSQVKQHTGGTVRRVVLDESTYSGDTTAPGWQNADIAGGSFAPIKSIMLDGGRSKPKESEPPRSATPDLDAAREFAKRLGVDPSQVSTGTAPVGAQTLGAVASAPVVDLIANLLQISDNVLAEAIARQVAIATGAEPSFSGAAAAVLKVLKDNNFDLTGVTMVDGSGLSTMDRVSAKLLGSILAAAGQADQDSRTAKLRPLLYSLPVAGGSGTLADRYTSGASLAGRGWVRAKTGTLDSVNTLAGVVLDADNRVLVFALMSNGSNADAGRAALDAIAAALRGCGCH